MRALEKNNNISLLNENFQMARYREQEVGEYANNPYIEALPDIFTEEEIIEQFTSYPIVEEGERDRSRNVRHHLIKRIKNFIQPLPDHFLIESKISTMLRRGYLSRNPLGGADYERLRILNDVKALREDERRNALANGMSHIRSTADSLSIIGISGIGKTTAIERLLSMYPQVIKHEEYKEAPLSRTQIVWLKIDCPYDGNLSTLCKSFFKAVDDILGTRYLEKYGYLNRITSSMMLNMTHLASMYGIGLLVIDEIQHLINAKNDPEEMLNFFVTLTNTVGIPTVMIGTFKALRILKKDFRQARRAGSEGNIIWDRMDKDSDEWDFFIETLWEFQWLKEKTALTEEFREIMYDQSQGITAVAVNLFILAQERALNTDSEKITKQIIKKTSKEDLHMIQPMIKALRDNNITDISRYEDIAINLDDITAKHRNSIDVRGKIKAMLDTQKEFSESKRKNHIEQITIELAGLGIFNSLSEKRIEVIVEKVVRSCGTDADYSNMKAEALKKAISENDRREREKQKTEEVHDKDDLRRIHEISIEKKIHPYEALKKCGYIKNPVDEFLKVE